MLRYVLFLTMLVTCSVASAQGNEGYEAEECAQALTPFHPDLNAEISVAEIVRLAQQIEGKSTVVHEPSSKNWRVKLAEFHRWSSAMLTAVRKLIYLGPSDPHTADLIKAVDIIRLELARNMIALSLMAEIELGDSEFQTAVAEIRRQFVRAHRLSFDPRIKVPFKVLPDLELSIVDRFSGEAAHPDQASVDDEFVFPYFARPTRDYWLNAWTTIEHHEARKHEYLGWLNLDMDLKAFQRQLHRKGFQQGAFAILDLLHELLRQYAQDLSVLADEALQKSADSSHVAELVMHIQHYSDWLLSPDFQSVLAREKVITKDRWGRSVRHSRFNDIVALVPSLSEKKKQLETGINTKR